MEACWQTVVAAVYGFGVMIKPSAEIELVAAQGCLAPIRMDGHGASSANGCLWEQWVKKSRPLRMSDLG